jgi:hypothetical protein
MKAQRIVQSVGQLARQLPESRDDPLDVHGSHSLGLRFRVAIKPGLGRGSKTRSG